jgi:hypothetical protein
MGLIAMRRPFTRMSVAVAPMLRRLTLALSPRAPDEPSRVSFSGRFTTDGKRREQVDRQHGVADFHRGLIQHGDGDDFLHVEAL